MLLLDDGALVLSPSDLTHAAACEFAVAHRLDVRLGRLPALPTEDDAMLERVGRLGAEHERRVLAELVAEHGAFDQATCRGVLQLRPPRGPDAGDRGVLESAHAHTLEALRGGVDVVYQAGFFDGTFTGWADFLVREPDGSYAVHDTKLARGAKVTALVQLAAYADQLLAAGVDVAPDVTLVLGDRTRAAFPLRDLLPVYRERRARLEALLEQRRAATAPVAWREPGYRACGRCDVCAAEVAASRDVLLVAGVTLNQRARLAEHGVLTIEQLGAGTEHVDGIGTAVLDRLRLQARLQLRQETEGPVFELVDPGTVAALPAPDPGDVFFDFEGDPLWSDDTGSAEQAADWGLEYLFGVVESPADPGDPAAEPEFRPFWAHTRAQEKQALVDFLAYVAKRREQFPGMHVYHYAPYERTALLRLAGRHGVGEEEVDELLRAGVLVDLYATVRRGLRTGAPSYSLKKLEPLYMGDEHREGDVTTAGDSIVEYALACAERDAGRTQEWEQRIEAIAEYNRYDCVSTLRLRDWLVARGAEAGVTPGGRGGPGRAGGDVDGAQAGAAVDAHGVDADLGVDTGADGGGSAVVDPLIERLAAAAEGGPGAPATPADRRAVALVGAALGYHRREDKPFWWAHFDRLRSEPADWMDARSTLLVQDARVLDDWQPPTGRGKLHHRRLALLGRLEPGSDLRPGDVYGIYDPPPGFAKTSTTGHRGWHERLEVESVGPPDAHGLDAARALDRVDDAPGAVLDLVVVVEKAPATDVVPDLPMALTPQAGPSTTTLEAAVREVAEHVAEGLPELPDGAALDLLRRRPPRTRSGLPLSRPATPEATVETITSAVLDLDHSYLAVQGPPGTGKTYTGGHVIAALAAQGWKIGVVAQSHAVVENMLTAVIAAGVDPGHVAKRPAEDKPTGRPWHELKKDKFGGFFASQQQHGYVVGGTAWSFASATQVPDGGYDLLVVDEAGQFALANTLAVAGAARNLLLLGDPQQLPQVSQGVHPEPVDRSALGWLTDGHDTLPDELGYFLARTWRMHPDLCAAVSTLSYEGRLEAVRRTRERSLEGVAPGIRTRFVEHAGNAVRSTEEAAEVVRVVEEVLGRRWVDPAAGADRPLAEQDVLVVVPYNAQVRAVRDALDAAGHTGVRVGTVDKFQGQEAPVAILTTAASSPEDVPRGMEFLLNRNRLNVAVSRAQWCAVIVRSAGITDYLPTHPDGLAELGAFIGLCTP